MKRVIEILMRRDGNTEKEAEERGLEMDYIEDILY